MENIKDNWKVAAFSIFTAIIVAMVTSWLATIDNAASIAYVDKKHDQQTIEIDKKADKEIVDKMGQTIIIMDSRIYDLWKKECDTK